MADGISSILKGAEIISPSLSAVLIPDPCQGLPSAHLLEDAKQAIRSSCWSRGFPWRGYVLLLQGTVLPGEGSSASLSLPSWESGSCTLRASSCLSSRPNFPPSVRSLGSGWDKKVGALGDRCTGAGALSRVQKYDSSVKPNSSLKVNFVWI